MRLLLLLAALAISGCSSMSGGGGSSGVPSAEPSRLCTYEPSFTQPGSTDVQCF